MSQDRVAVEFPDFGTVMKLDVAKNFESVKRFPSMTSVLPEQRKGMRHGALPRCCQVCSPSSDLTTFGCGDLINLAVGRTFASRTKTFLCSSHTQDEKIEVARGRNLGFVGSFHDRAIVTVSILQTL